MCGFFATNDHDLVLDRYNLDQWIGFRGPDFRSDVIEYKGWRVYHARLAVISLSHLAIQPIINETGLTVFNGEIFNYNDLAEKYNIENVGSDTLVLHELLSVPSFEIGEIEGFFAFIKISPDGDLMYCARDYFGVKPLFYKNKNKSITISSEPNALIDLYASEWNADAVEEYDLFRYPIISGSYFSGINQVHPGECMINGRYFDLKECFLTSKYSSVAIECLEGDVEFGLKSREISDVSYSMLFSGGVDSNILRVYSDSQPDYLFTGSFNGAGYDKDVVDNMLGKGLIDRLIKVDVSDEEFISNLKYLVRLRKEPLSVPNQVILYSIASEARSLGQKVLISGEGADEFFAGYDRIYSFFLVNEFSVSEFIRRYSYSGLNVSERIYTYFDDYFRRLDELSPFEKVRYFFIDKHLPILFRRLDFSLMAAGIEGREPFVTRRMLLSSLKLSGDSLIGGGVGKIPLRNMLSQHLGKKFAFEKKVGFPIDLTKGRFSSVANSNYEIWRKLNMEAL